MAGPASTDVDDLLPAIAKLLEEGARRVVVSRAHEPALASDGAQLLTITPPPVGAADPRGAGDSQTAGMTARLAADADWEDVLRTGAACGALNVVRHGLGTGGAEAVAVLADRVELAPLST